MDIIVGVSCKDVDGEFCDFCEYWYIFIVLFEVKLIKLNNFLFRYSILERFILYDEFL